MNHAKLTLDFERIAGLERLGFEAKNDFQYVPQEAQKTQSRK